MSASQGTGGSGPQDQVADAAHDGGDSAPEPDSVASVTAAGASPTMTEPAAQASSSRTQLGATILEIVPEVDTTTTASAAMAGDGDDNELKVVMGHPVLRAPRDVSLFEAMCSSESGPGSRKSGSVS
jgi:hypothetical protein